MSKKKAIQGKYGLELNIVGDGGTFLNFWDSIHGNDVVARVVGDRLYIDGKKAGIKEFVALVKKSISERQTPTDATK